MNTHLWDQPKDGTNIGGLKYELEENGLPSPRRIFNDACHSAYVINHESQLTEYFDWGIEMEKAIDSNTIASEEDKDNCKFQMQKGKEVIFRNKWNRGFATYVFMSEAPDQKATNIEVSEHQRSIWNGSFSLDLKKIPYSRIKELFEEFKKGEGLSPQTIIKKQHTVESVDQTLSRTLTEIKDFDPKGINKDTAMLLSKINETLAELLKTTEGHIGNIETK